LSNQRHGAIFWLNCMNVSPVASVHCIAERPFAISTGLAK
jgi:hypothetical protein